MTGRTSTRVPDARMPSSWAAELEDRPLGPFFEARFTVAGLRAQVGVVRGSADLLDAVSDRAHELLARWLTGRGPTWPADDPETLLLLSLAEPALPWLAPGERARRLAPALAADLLVQDVLDEGALGGCVRVGDDAALGGLPPRPGGWRIQLPGRDGSPQQVLLDEGGVSTRGEGADQVTATADRAWRAAVEAERTSAGGGQVVAAGTPSTTRSAPA